MKLFQRQDNYLTNIVSSQKQMDKILADNKKNKDIISKCNLCIENNVYKKHLIISKGTHTILRLKTGASCLAKYHCIIQPIGHVNSILICEEEVEVEIQRYKNCLVRMFEKIGFSLLFLESAIR